MKDVWRPMYAEPYERKRWNYRNARAFAQQHAADNLDASLRLVAWAQKRTRGKFATEPKR